MRAAGTTCALIPASFDVSYKLTLPRLPHHLGPPRIVVHLVER